MAEESAFTRILNGLSAADTGVSEKTASDSTPAPDSTARLLSTVRSVVTNKTANAPATPSTPSSALTAMAKQAQEAEQALAMKLAHAQGAAFCDGFFERYAQYDTALSGVEVKTAQTQPNVEHVARAAYSQAVQDMEKKAQAEFEQGFNDQVQEVHKVAADIHYLGQQAAGQIVAAARQNP